MAEYIIEIDLGKSEDEKLTFIADLPDFPDISELLHINYEHLDKEIEQSSFLLNQFGIMKSIAEAELKEYKLEGDIKIAEISKKIRRKLLDFAEIEKGNGRKGVKVTEKQIETAVEIDPGVKIIKKNIISREKNLKIIESLYWSLRSKDDKLIKMCNNFKPKVGEFSLNRIENEEI